MQKNFYHGGGGGGEARKGGGGWGEGGPEQFRLGLHV